MKENLTKEEIQIIVDFYQKLVDKFPDNVTVKDTLQEWHKRLQKP